MTQEKVLAEIIETGEAKIKSARIVIQAKPSMIFYILNNHNRHKDIDGSATITANISGPDELVLDSKFGMKMHLGVNYRIRNTVV